MFAEIAQLLLCLSLSLSFYFGVRGIAVSYTNDFRKASDRMAKSLAISSNVITLLVLSCFLLLMQLFLVSDFSVILVASHSNALLPFKYKIPISVAAYLYQSIGRISADIICPYPPGIPLAIPGERIEKERVDWLIKQGLMGENLLDFCINVL